MHAMFKTFHLGYCFANVKDGSRNIPVKVIALNTGFQPDRCPPRMG